MVPSVELSGDHVEPAVENTSEPAQDAKTDDSFPDVWSTLTRYPPQTQHDHVSRRRLRSRSSPVRQGPRVRARSPSVCSPRRRRKDRSREQSCRSGPGNFFPPEYALENTNPSEEYIQAPNSYWRGLGSTCSSAYFSFRPPAVPLRLVPIVTPAQPPLPPQMYTGATRVSKVSFSKKKTQGCDSTIRCMLQDLVTTLPLQNLDKSPTCASCVDHELLSKTDERVQLSSRSYVKIRQATIPTRSLGDTDSARRSIAIQAKSTQFNDSSHRDKKKAGVELEPAEEWLGGVRALRDSHVRLVLRQLRHIKRLNRALDGAPRSPPPPPKPSSPRTPPTHAPVVASHAHV